MGPCYCGYFLHIVAFVGNCSAVTAYQQATSLTIKIQFIVLTVRLIAVMISWLHGAVVWLPLGLVQQFCVWTLFDCACGVQGRRHTGSDGKHNRTPCRITASFSTLVTCYITVTGHLGLVPCYLYFKSKMEVLRENIGPTHCMLFTDGTLEHLLGTTFLYLMMETL